ncbi:SocA family protein [Patescibacteria group bacterium]|nr:SocA family protein [Patescibacteria group bacterium]
MRPNEKKFKELLIYIVDRCSKEEQIPETKLWKLLYFSEANFFEKKKRTISGVDYFKNNYGPTPDYRTIKKIFPEISEYVLRTKKNIGDGKVKRTYKLSKKYRFSYLTKEEKKIIDETCEKYGNLNTREIVHLAHKDPPYIISKDKDKIDFSDVVYREKWEEGDLENEEEQVMPSDVAEKILAYARR